MLAIEPACLAHLQLQLVDDPIPGGFDAASQQPLKRLDFVRTQGGFWLTWVSTTLSPPPPVSGWRTVSMAVVLSEMPHVDAQRCKGHVP